MVGEMCLRSRGREVAPRNMSSISRTSSMWCLVSFDAVHDIEIPIDAISEKAPTSGSSDYVFDVFSRMPDKHVPSAANITGSFVTYSSRGCRKVKILVCMQVQACL